MATGAKSPSRNAAKSILGPLGEVCLLLPFGASIIWVGAVL